MSSLPSKTRLWPQVLTGSLQGTYLDHHFQCEDAQEDVHGDIYRNFSLVTENKLLKLAGSFAQNFEKIKLETKKNAATKSKLYWHISVQRKKKK